MTLLEQTFQQLNRAGLTQSAEAFSRDYLGKSRSWFAYQKHAGRDYSVAAAIQCLRNIRSQQRSSGLSSAQQVTLRQVEAQLTLHLNTHYCVADVC